LRSFDSWIAVAMAMVAARGGSPRLTAMAVMVAAYPVWTGSKVTLVPSAVAWHLGPPRLSVMSRTPR
jgi:hypothetical protein